MMLVRLDQSRYGRRRMCPVSKHNPTRPSLLEFWRSVSSLQQLNQDQPGLRSRERRFSLMRRHAIQRDARTKPDGIRVNRIPSFGETMTRNFATRVLSGPAVKPLGPVAPRARISNKKAGPRPAAAPSEIIHLSVSTLAPPGVLRTEGPRRVARRLGPKTALHGKENADRCDASRGNSGRGRGREPCRGI